MGRGREELKTCIYCGKRYPISKMIRTTKYSFGYYDDEAGIKYRGQPMTVYVCKSCARHRGIKDERQKGKRR
ncbi:hypothetical protein DRN74_04985 [Candidatus Micrarchaeota archaeon]|nr:MAG: hypothetical protein DRN74_04985 [Candidatus Micrarchaeota archaeon]